MRAYKGAFIDLMGKRVLFMGRPRGRDRSLLASSEIVDGDIMLADRRLRQEGWAALSTTLAKDRKLRIGDTFTLPTRTGAKQLRLAATMNNLGWFPGAIVVNAREFKRLWGSSKASILEVTIKGDAPLEESKSAVQAAIGERSGMRVSTAADRQEISSRVVDQALSRLNQISTMMIIAVVLAAAAAMFGAAWQRRRRLWSMVSMGMGALQLYRTIFLEAALILLVGCLIGAAFGILGQGLMGRWLHLTMGAPVPFVPAWGLMLKTLGLITGLAVVAVAIPISLAFPIKRQAIFSRE